VGQDDPGVDRGGLQAWRKMAAWTENPVEKKASTVAQCCRNIVVDDTSARIDMLVL
jgi:hypothetical protein